MVSPCQPCVCSACGKLATNCSTATSQTDSDMPHAPPESIAQLLRAARPTSQLLARSSWEPHRGTALDAKWCKRVAKPHRLNHKTNWRLAPPAVLTVPGIQFAGLDSVRTRLASGALPTTIRWKYLRCKQHASALDTKTRENSSDTPRRCTQVDVCVGHHYMAETQIAPIVAHMADWPITTGHLLVCSELSNHHTATQRPGSKPPFSRVPLKIFAQDMSQACDATDISLLSQIG